MNVFFKKLEEANIKFIGFDMDGTIYDEYDFIVQPYKEISKLFEEQNEAFDYMCFKWLEKGSSYNKIFCETFDKFNTHEQSNKDQFIAKVITIFRNFEPSLILSSRAKTILEFCKKNFFLFLITDGNPDLQKKKFLTLGLNNYFDKDRIIFTGEYADEYKKPNKKSIELIDIDCEKTIFFGDRYVDKEFALSAKMKFRYVRNMIFDK